MNGNRQIQSARTGLSLKTRQAGYLSVLRQELSARRKGNPAYSQRAFARDIGVPANRLTEIFSGKQGLSAKVADQIARKLSLPEGEHSYFVDLVRASHSRSPQDRKDAAERVKVYQASAKAKRRYHGLKHSELQSLSNWLPFAILELMKTSDFVPSVTWVATRLGLPQERVATAVRHLVSAKLLRCEQSAWTALQNSTLTGSGVPSLAIKHFHRQILQKASESLFHSSLEEREFQSLVFAVDKQRMSELKERVQTFVRDIDRDFGTSVRPGEVACLSTQLFFLTEKA